MAEGSTVSDAALREVLARSGPLSPARAVEIVRRVAEALTATETDPVARCAPISPTTIRLTGGAVRLVGSGASGDPGADSHALAGVLFECLTGTVPSPPIARPSRLRPSIPAAFDAVIARGLADNPADRYPTAGALAAAAEHALSRPVHRIRAFAAVVAALAVTGALLGVLWAAIAPPIHGVVALTRDGERVHGYLGNEADHFFVAAFLVLGLLGVAAVVAATAVWQWRAHRGPGMITALMGGLILAATLTAAVGALLVHLRYGTVDVATAPVSDQHRVQYVVEAPPVFFGHSGWQIAATLLLPASMAALVYGVCAAANARDDLGADPPAGGDRRPGHRDRRGD